MRPSEWEQFYRDIAFRGIKEPIEIIADGTIVDGHHRHKAALEIGMPQVPYCDAPLNGDTPFDYMLKAAVLRRHLSDDQRAMMASMWAEENKQEPQAGPGRGHKTTPPRRGDVLNAEHPTQAAGMALFNVKSRKKVDKATFVRKHNPELAATVHKGDTALNAAYRAVKMVDEQVRIAATQPPTGLYQVIVVDPPWPYGRTEDPTHRARNPYESMTLEQLAELKMPCADDCILWLWTTNAFLPDAFTLLAAWRFEYKTCLTWVKEHMGLGDWLRGKTEHCLLAVKGKARVIPGNATTALLASNTSHSTKPDAFYELVERLCPGTKIDLFARRQRTGWAVWGADIAE